MRRLSLLLIFLLFCLSSFSQNRHYRELMNDPNVDIPEVIEAANKWFETHGKEEGSGWKGYQRWLVRNMNAYGKSGKRSETNPYNYLNAFRDFNQNYPLSPQFRTSSYAWRELGPFRVDSITRHYAPGNGRIEEFYQDPSDSLRIYVSGNYGGFRRTTDGGTTWARTTDTLPIPGVPSFAISPTNHDSVFISAGLRPFMGIYLSEDGGLSWQQTPFNPTNLGLGGLGTSFYFRKLVHHPSIPHLLFALTSDGLYRTTDDFQTWSQVWNGNMHDLEFHPSQSNILYTYDGNVPYKYRVLRSTDTGLTWTQSDSIPVSYSWKGDLAVSDDCPDCVYLGAYLGLWRSTNQGQNFSQLSNIRGEAQYLEVSDQDTSIVMIGAVDLHRSLDGGRNFNQITWWSTYNTPFNGPHYVHADPRNIKFVNGKFYVGTDGYMVVSADTGNTWKRLSEGAGLRESYELGVSQCNAEYSIIGCQDNGSSIHQGDFWVEYYGGDGMTPLLHPLNENWFIASTQNGNRFRSQELGQDLFWVTPQGQNSFFTGVLEHDPFNNMGAFHFGRKIFHTTDFGSSWTNNGVQPFGSNDIFEATVAKNNPDLMYVVGWQEIKRTLDGGQTFTTLSSAPMPGNTPAEIVTSPNNDSILVMVFSTITADSQKVFLSRDMGNTWENITFNLYNMPVWTAVIDHSDSSNIYLGCQLGVFTMPLDGNQWQLYNFNLPNIPVRKLAIQFGSNILRAATYGRGMWEIPLVDRANFPKVQKVSITDPPTHWAPEEGDLQTVTSVISYADSLTSVYVRWSTNPLALDSIISMSNSQDSTWVADQTFPDYPAGTQLWFSVNAVGSNSDTSTTYRYDYTVKPDLDYCWGVGWDVGGTNQMHIDSVALAGIQNASGFSRYSDFTNQYATLQAGSSYPISVKLPRFTFYADSVVVWVDYNHDHILADSEATGMPRVPVSLVTTGTLQVPANVPVGDTVLMRIRETLISNPMSPCGEYYGEVEDYSIIFSNTPTLSYHLSGTVLCAGDQLNFQYTGDALDSLRWTFSNGGNNWTSTSQDDSLQFSSPGFYDLELMGFVGADTFMLMDSAAFEVVAVNVTANSSAASICEGDSVMLTGSGAGNYVWDNGVTDGVPFAPSGTATYSVVGTDGNGCADSASVTVQVNSGPNVTIQSSAPSLCSGETLTLNGQGGVIYNWSGGVQNGVPFVPAGSNTYTVIGTDLLGCSDTASVTIPVNQRPTVSIQASATSICAGDPVTLSGQGGIFYSWSGGVQNGVAFFPTGTNSYSLIGTDLLGCTDTASITIQVNASPNVSIQASASSVCEGDPVTLTGQGAQSYSWTGGVQNGVSFVPLASASYQVTGTGTNGCSDTASVFVQVNSLPLVVANSSNSQVCAGESLTLWGGGAQNYSWTNGVLDGVPFAPANTQTYQVTGTDANGCENQDTITIPVVQLDTNVTLAANTLISAASGVTFQWLNCGNGFVAISGAVSSTFTPQQNGSYALQVSGNGCVDTSGCHTVIVVGLEGEGLLEVRQVYPNPSPGNFRIDLGKVFAQISLEVLDDRGRLILREDYQQRNFLEVDLSREADGPYLLHLKSESGSATLRVVKRK